MGRSSQTTEQTIPAWHEDFLRNTVLPKALEINSTPFTEYTGRLAANLGSYTQQAADIYGNLAGMTPADYSAMNQANMSSYTQNVMDPALARMERERAKQMSQEQAYIAGSGAFGNDRRGVFEAESAANYGLGRDAMIADLRRQGYNEAQAATMSQLGNRLGAAGALTGIGGQQTALEQTGIDAAYNEFIRKQNSPYQQYSALLGAGQGNYGQTQTTTQKRGLFDYLTAGATAAAGMA